MFCLFFNQNVLFWGLGSVSEIVLGSTHIVNKLLFSIFPSILTFDFDLILTFWGPKGLLLGSIWGSKTVSRSTHVLEQLLFLWFLQFWHLNLAWFWGCFAFLGPWWAVFRVGVGLRTGFGCSNGIKQLLFSTFPSILTFDFDLIMGSFFYFCGPNGLFFGLCKVQKLFWGQLM